MASLFELAGLGKEQAELLDLLDSVQLAGIGDGVLPQIVVVGDQSSGKSSVLTRLTGIEFPRSQYACTKFATEIRLRRSSEYPDDRTRAWILPDKTVARSDRHRQALEDFNQDIVETPENIAKVMQDATNLIAPSSPTSGVGPKFSSKDKLIIQKTGPSLPALTLVDLPGLVKLANEKQSPEDLRLIEELTDSYIKDPASIILAVVSGAQQFSQAPILQKVTRWDPSGTRTMGLLTKPDVADRECYTDEFIRLMTRRDANTQYHFRLGWHVLLNPDAFNNPSFAERNMRETQYWLGRKWAKLPEYMRGADALRLRLSRQIQKEIGRQLPAIQERLQKWEENCETALSKLGPVLLTEKDKAKELGRLFSLSHQLIQQAVYGHLVNPPKIHFFPDDYDPRGIPAQHLRAKAVAESDAFEESFRLLGLKCRFTDKNGKVDVKAKREFAKKVVEPLLPQIRGRELPGDPNTRAPYMVFKRYSKQWFQLAKAYERKIEAACAAFLGELKESAWPSRMREPLETNHLRKSFGDLLIDARAELEQINQETFALEIQPFDKDYEKCIADAVKASEAAGSRTLSDAEKVVEQMLAYYMLAERIYIRNVIYQVAERHLLSGMMKLFDTSEVMGMSDETIDKITLEDPDAQNRRQTLEAEKERIEEARRKCDAVAARTSPRLDTEALPTTGLDDDDNGGLNYGGGDIPAAQGAARSDDGDSGINHDPKAKSEVEVDEEVQATGAAKDQGTEGEIARDRIEQDGIKQETIRVHNTEEEHRKEEERRRERQKDFEDRQRRLEQKRLDEEMTRRHERETLERERQEQQRERERQQEHERKRREESSRAAAAAAAAAEARRLDNERRKEADRQARRLRTQRREAERQRVERLEMEARDARRAEARRRRLERRAARREEAKRLEQESQKMGQVLTDIPPNDNPVRVSEGGLRHDPRLGQTRQIEEEASRDAQVFPSPEWRQRDQGQPVLPEPQVSQSSSQKVPGADLHGRSGHFKSRSLAGYELSAGDIGGRPGPPPPVDHGQPALGFVVMPYEQWLETRGTQQHKNFYHGVATGSNMPGHVPTDDHEDEDDFVSTSTTSASTIPRTTGQPQTFSPASGGTDGNASILGRPNQLHVAGAITAGIPGQVSRAAQVPAGPYFHQASSPTQSRGRLSNTSSSTIESSGHQMQSASGMGHGSGSGSRSSGSGKKRSSGLGKLFGSRR